MKNLFSYWIKINQALLPPSNFKLGFMTQKSRGLLFVFFSLTSILSVRAQCGSEPFPDQWSVHELQSGELPYRSVYIYANNDIDGDGRKDIVTGGWWYKNPGSASGNWVRSTIGGSFKNMAFIHDFDGDGDPDLLGTTGAYTGSDMVWARNNGSGNFTIHTNIPSGDTNYSEPFLAGIAGANFQSGGPFQMAINWNGAESTDSPVQMLTVPADPVNTQWTLSDISSESLGEDLQKGDIDDDGDLDLFQSSNWLRNNGNGTWTAINTGISYVTTPDRAQLSDFDGDGDLDAVVGQLGLGSNSARHEFAWFEAPANPSNNWTRHTLAIDITGSLSVFAEDIDQDGDNDIVVGEWKGSNRLIAFENDLCDSGTWIRHTLNAGGTGFDHHDGARVVDIDNDGDFDVVSIGWDNIVPRIFENTSITSNNQDPLANAGSDQAITLPTNSIILNGSGSDPDGGNVTYLWTQQSGPNTATLSNENTDDLTANNLVEGIYVFRLTVTDDENDTAFDDVSVTVNPEPNADPPLANAGADQNITLPSNSVILNGSGSDPDGGNVTFVWTQTIGPNTASLSGNTTADLTANNLVEGIYVFRLTVTDDESDSTFDEVSVTVNPEPNTDPPLANAGADQNITLPTNSIVLNGSGSDPDGGNVSFQWTQESGPSTATLSEDTTADLTASALAEGIYVFRLTVTDDENDTTFDEVNVMVAPKGNTDLPLADAGTDQNITLPTNSITLNGSGSDPEGGNVTFQWTQESGPNTSTLTDENTDDLTASNLVEGTYVFRLTVANDEDDTAFDEVNVTVVAEGSMNQPPLAITEANTLTGALPLEVTFTGSNSTDDVSVASYLWDFGNGATSTDADPTYTFTTAGVFTIELTVTDSEGLTNSASVNITVTEPVGKETGIILEINPSKDGVAKILLLNQLESVTITEISIHDFTGRFIETFDEQQIASENDSYEIPVAMLHNGMYYISVKTSNGEQLAINLLVRN